MSDDNPVYYTLDGDLNQMGIMRDTLRNAGFRVAMLNVYPGFRKNNKDGYIRALQFLLDNRIKGWWNQEREMIEHGVCTQEEFDNAIGRVRK